jgi:hypothetical protein
MQEQEKQLPPIPAPGDEIYVETSFHTSHPEDDFIGGLCKVVRVEDGDMVIVEEYPGWRHCWGYLGFHQEELKNRYGNRRGYMLDLVRYGKRQR